ncbi:hypothetical protein BKH46_03285 [Helicobacter sp. 12S02634-8]|uniref:hypothetical protein n=1 Tax=Helicobacter sp. 12S02634-8 TaxID=1476199 RepID=UPI000BA694C4|nr:hypothetical protein [Helicobacter sp. 12S02634-8]PAF47477.1 hypothetical protein BKH46_03285 [Helicobacter sp. 12S02634-8]
MRLDFLQNPPTQKHPNQLLIAPSYPNPSPINPSELASLQNDSKALAALFGGDMSVPFGFLCAHWLELLTRISKTHKIAYAISSHQQGYAAIKLLDKPIYKLIPDKQSGLITSKSLLEAIAQGCTCLIVPFVNEDILTQNPIKDLKATLQKHTKNAIFITDISYALSLNLPIPDIIDSHTLLLINGESLGLLRSHGALIAKDFIAPEIFPKTLSTPKLFAALQTSIRSLAPSPQDTKEIFYTTLQSLIKTDIGLFAPLAHTLPNALPLRFSSIKARNLLQALLLENIYGINGAQCLYGLFAPSFVLQEMGYSELESRELLSVSYTQTPDFDKLCKTIAYCYSQLRVLGI